MSKLKNSFYGGLVAFNYLLLLLFHLGGDYGIGFYGFRLPYLSLFCIVVYIFTLFALFPERKTLLDTIVYAFYGLSLIYLCLILAELFTWLPCFL